jgi:CheY-like chemotaxis protein
VQPRILVTGDYLHPEFSRLLEHPLIHLIPINRLEGSDQMYELVVIAQSLPHQFSPDTIEKIRAQFPLAPLVALLGSWCEGELRSGAPSPGVRRVYWHQWQGQLQSFVDQFQRNGVTCWNAPATATAGDLILQTETSSDCSTSGAPSVAVSAFQAGHFQALRDSLAVLGWNGKWLERMLDQRQQAGDPGGGQEAALWNFERVCVDSSAIDSDLYDRIEMIRGWIPESPVIVLAGYPRWQEVRRLMGLGVSRVISKPYSLDDLRAAMAGGDPGQSVERGAPRAARPSGD